MKEEQSEPQPFVLNEDYYFENGLIVMTANYHIKRGHCCGTRCKWCPFDPKHEIGTTKVSVEFTGLITDRS